MLKITVDGKTIEVKPGTTVIQAAEEAGIFVPRYCYHPGLSVAGNCRMCLVEIEKSPKLQISCNTPVTDGMVVHTKSEAVKVAQKNVLEFLLINHPLDCPVCDQSGECDLQNYYMDYGQYDPRFQENKVKKSKAVPVGPTVMLDSERCVLCSRCVRFTDEITKTHEFGIFNRGDHSEVGLFPGAVLDNSYSGNVVDICPVGALTDRDFRFKCRVWYLSETDSVCNGCARGCNISIHTNKVRRQHGAGERVMRLKPRFNAEVNQWWICDEGRYGYKKIDHNRIQRVLSKSNGAVKESTWEAVFLDIALRLKSLVDQYGPEVAAVLPSPQLTTEDLYMIKTIFGKLGVCKFESELPGQQGMQDDFLIRADKNPNTLACQILRLTQGPGHMEKILEEARAKKLKALYIFEHDLTKAFTKDRVREALAGLELVVFQGPNLNPVCEMAHYVLPSASYAEKDGTFINFQGRLQRIGKALDPMGESRGDWEILQALAREWNMPSSYRSSEQVFEALAGSEPVFQGLTYQKIGKQGITLALDKDKVAV